MKLETIEDTFQDVGLIYRSMGRKGLETIENVGPSMAKVIEALDPASQPGWWALPLAGIAMAQEPALTYQMPPQVLADIIDAPPTPGVYLSPDKEWLLLLERPGNPSIEEVAAPELRLAGLRINPRSMGRS